MDPDISGSSYYSIEPNNTARLKGGVIGTGLADSSSLRKIVKTTVCEPNNDYQLGDAFITRLNKNTEDVSVIIPLRNLSNEFLCDLKLYGVKLKYKDGDIIARSQGIAFVSGLVGKYESNSTSGEFGWVHDCLEAGQIGYVLMDSANTFDMDRADLTLYSEVADIQVKEVSRDLDSLGFIREPVKFLATSYTYENGKLAISVQNRGDKNITNLHSFPKLLLLDGEGFPVLYKRIRWNVPSNSIVLPGESIEAGMFYSSDTSLLKAFDGISQTIRPICSFDLEQN